MAIVSKGYQMTVSMVGADANTTSVEYQLNTTDAVQAETDALAIVTALQAVSGGFVTGYRLSQVFEETGAITYPAPQYQSSISASMTGFVSGEGSKKANVRIPIPADGIFVATSGEGYNRVDLTETATYMALFQSGGVAKVSDGETLGDVISGVRVTRSRRGA